MVGCASGGSRVIDGRELESVPAVAFEAILTGYDVSKLKRRRGELECAASERVSAKLSPEFGAQPETTTKTFRHLNFKFADARPPARSSSKFSPSPYSCLRCPCEGCGFLVEHRHTAYCSWLNELAAVVISGGKHPPDLE